MTGALNECTAHDLATEDVATLTADEVVSAAIEWFTEHGYDAAPVVEEEQPIGHVEIDTLQDASDDETVREHARPITLEETISADATFRETLEALYDSPYYYLGGRNRVTGILTRADLNTSPAYIHLYDHIAILERAFREVILEVASDWNDRDDVELHEEEIRAIEDRHHRAQRANIELEAIHYAQFSTLTTIVAGVEDCWRTFGFRSAETAERELGDVTDVRNVVAHSNLLVENTAGGLGGGRTVGAVLDAYDTIQECISVR